VLNKHNEELLQLLLNQLVSNYLPQRVMLFGSYAYGTPDINSDIDLLIIKDTQEKLFQPADQCAEGCFRSPQRRSLRPSGADS
jgi:predicted nucleotidyltransferase